MQLFVSTQAIDLTWETQCYRIALLFSQARWLVIKSSVCAARCFLCGHAQQQQKKKLPLYGSRNTGCAQRAAITPSRNDLIVNSIIQNPPIKKHRLVLILRYIIVLEWKIWTWIRFPNRNSSIQPKSRFSGPPVQEEHLQVSFKYHAS